jgi:N-carbamoyl-L-amino-acid hydrolase
MRMLRINGSRLLEDLKELGRIGGTPDGGVSRPAMSPADVAGREWYRGRVEAAGLHFREDSAGNLSAVLAADDPTARTLLTGSHLDTVPNGGRFDGALGALAALEALRTIREADLRLPVHLEAMSFTDEEGEMQDLLGSRALAGTLTSRDLDQARRGREELGAGMRRLGITPQGILAARREPQDLVAFVELHIEQGARLEATGVDIGVVTSIVGIRSHWLRFVGQAAHAGTAPMDERRDALWGAAAFVRDAWELVMSRFSPGVVNCGQIHVQPGAFNIVPAEVRLALELRHGTEPLLDEMEDALLGLAEEVARGHHLALETEPAAQCISASMNETIMEAIEKAATELGLRHMRLMSFAGHDTQAMSAITPSGMLFVPSVDGISHSPSEFTRPEDLLNGANTLLHTLLELVPGSG